MRFIQGIDAFHETEKTAITLGKFDGLHRGHEELIRRVIKKSKEENLKSVVCAFRMISYFESMGIERKIVMTSEEQFDRLEQRVDYLIDCPFTKEFSQITAEAFIEDILVNRFHASYVVVGTDFCFGHNKKGDVHMLKKYEQKYGYKLIVVEKLKHGDREISSTYVKEALGKGDIQLVNQMLGYPYTVKGIVEHGAKLGRTIGFPTMNVKPERHKMMPPNGVYVVRVQIDGVWYDGIGNIGVKPTVSDMKDITIESHLFDFHQEVYGKEVSVQLLAFRRPEQKFHDIHELQHTIEKDLEYGKAFFSEEHR